MVLFADSISQIHQRKVKDSVEHETRDKGIRESAFVLGVYVYVSSGEYRTPHLQPHSPPSVEAGPSG